MPKVIASKRVQQPTAASLSASLRSRLRKLALRLSEVRVAKLIGVSRPTLSRAMAGLPIQRGTLHLVTTQIPIIEAASND